MRVLQVISEYYPAEAYGGTIKVAHSLSTELVRRGHDVTVYTSDTLDKSARQKNRFAIVDGVKVHYFRNLSNRMAWNRMEFNPGIALQMRRDKGKFDVIHLHGHRNFASIVVHHYAAKFDIPYVLQAAGAILPISGKLALKQVFDRLFGKKILQDCAKMIVANQTEIDEHKKMGISEEKLVKVRMAFNIGTFEQLPQPGQFRRKFNIQEKYLILFLGRINRIKGLAFLVETFGRLARDRGDIMLVIVGPDDGYQTFLQNLVQRLNLSKKVLFTGFLAGQDKLSAFVDANVFVQTSISERGPGSPFEAIMCNTPIIVTRNTGCGEMVSQIDAGYLVDYGNVTELVDRMSYVLDHSTEAREKTQKAKQYIITNLSRSKVIEDYEKVYESVLRSRNKKRSA